MEEADCKLLQYNMTNLDRGNTGFSESTLSIKVKSESESRSVVSHSFQPHGLYSPLNSPEYWRV